jgi:hypothetical protein
VNVPFSSVTTAFLVPFKTTVTDAAGLPSAVVTRPLMVPNPSSGSLAKTLKTVLSNNARINENLIIGNLIFKMVLTCLIGENKSNSTDSVKVSKKGNPVTQ